METLQDLAFTTYIDNCKQLINERRLDFDFYDLPKVHIVTTNAPFALYPNSSDKHHPYGVILIHGLFDCPFSMREMGDYLKNQGIPSLAPLLPGHGTRPEDLLTVTYREWLATLRYSIRCLREGVDKVFLVGYSTGAALAVYEALEEENIAGLVLIAPAIKIKAPIRLLAALQRIKGLLGRSRDWLFREPEIDYAKYRSIPFNPVYEVATLASQNTIRHARQALHCPMLMIISDVDETISSKHALKFFTASSNIKSQLLLYTNKKLRYKDARIEVRNVKSVLNIKHYSHLALTFSEKNPHYGLNGDFSLAPNAKHPYIYGAYNRMSVKMYDFLYRYGLIKQPRRGLTYNPDFEFMMQTITSFIQDS